MPIATLPPELVSLVQHAELNESGWWEKSAQRLITAVVWASSKQLHVPGIVDELRITLGVHIQRSKVDAIVGVLCKDGTLVRMPNGQIKVSEEKIRELSQEMQEVERSEQLVANKFIAQISPYCPKGVKADDVWQSFINKFLVPLIHDLGVRAYELISGSRTNLGSV